MARLSAAIGEKAGEDMEQAGITVQARVVIEPLTSAEEVDFIDAINAAVDRGEMSREESQAWIKREYELMFP